MKLDFPPVGVRTERRRQRRTRNRRVAAGCLVVLLAILTSVGLRSLRSKPGSPPAPSGEIAAKQVTFLVITTRSDDLSEQADVLTLFALGPKERNPFAMFVPTETQAEVPGHGFDSAGRAMSFGGVPLQKLTVSNLLGVRVDHTLAVSEQVMGDLVDQVGGLDVEVSSRMLADDGSGRLVPIFEPGRRHMDGAAARKYLSYRGPEETEIARFPRAQQVWEGLMAAWARSGGIVEGLFERLGDALDTDVTPSEVGKFFGAFARAGASARVYAVLPVTPVGAGGSAQTFRLDDAQVAQLVSQHLSGALPPRGVGAGARVQILNGNGTPEVGERVARILVPAGFKVVLDGNASSFDFARTKILIYASDEASLALARRIRELLGAGEIEIDRRQQTIVDVTIVVGKDFLARKG
jgi:LCP family protein required for cell wall assembly